MKKLLLALALLFAPTLASAQCNGVFPPLTVCGNPTGTGNLPRAMSPSAFIGAAGGTNGQIQYNNGGALGGFTASGDATINTSTGVVTIQPGVVGSSELAANAVPVFQTRTAAAALDLSAFSAVRTLGYATAGDGGGAVFQKTVGTIKDTYILTGTIAGGSGYANNTYDNIPLTGGSSNGCRGRVITSGGAVTQVLISIPCGGYVVGDVLSTDNSFIGGGTGFTFTVATMSTPLGSFTDSAGNKWQIVTDIGGWPNVRQYGAKLDWNGSDGSATNDRPSFMSAIAQLAIPFSTTNALVTGGTLLVPRGASLLCGGANGAVLPIPQGVVLRGVGVYGGTMLKFCTAEPDTNHLIQLCDIYTNFGEFGCAVKDLAIRSDGNSAANIAAIYSISGQQFPLIDNVYIEPGIRGCVYYDFGKGGAANAIFLNFDCENDGAITNSSFVVGSNVGGSQVIISNAVFGCAPLCTHTALTVSGGEVHASNIHIEGTSDGILVQNTQPSSFRNINVVSPCTTGMTLSAANPNGVTLIEQFLAASCTTAIVNGHPGGVAFTGNVIKQITCNPGNPCN